jgi:hypothetical protein
MRSATILTCARVQNAWIGYGRTMTQLLNHKERYDLSTAKRARCGYQARANKEASELAIPGLPN